MAEERVQRRLAAILAADVVGYGRLMEIDETATLGALKTRRIDILDPLVSKHQGRIFKVTGDGVLVEFASAVNAVECAVDLQQAFTAVNADVPEDRRIVYRIGMHVGDVLVEGGDLFGDGVNIASRLEALAPPGGILVSAAARDHVGSRSSVAFQDAGDQALKNISLPVRAYRVADKVPVPPHTATPSSEKPTVAILPFNNMSGDPEQEYFADGITEDIITELSRFTSFSVIARNTSFQFRGKSLDIGQIGRQLGVRYVVEGSVRRLGPKIRINAQLIDATTSKHLWAQRYDRDIEDLFAVQDEVVRSVVTSLAFRVEDTEILARSRKPPQNWAAYDYVLKARERMVYGESWLPVEEFLRRAIELDSSIPEAHSLLVYVLIEKYIEGGDQTYLDEALGLGRTAIALNTNGSGPHVAMAYLSFIMGRLDLSEFHGRRAIELNPNNIQARIHRAEWLTICGRCEEALSALDQISEMVPNASDFLWAARGMVLFQLRRYQEVVDTLGRWIKPDSVVWAHAIAALVRLDRMDEARLQLAAMIKANPGTTIAKVLRYAPYQRLDMRDHLSDALRKAGLPD